MTTKHEKTTTLNHFYEKVWMRQSSQWLTNSSLSLLSVIVTKVEGYDENEIRERNGWKKAPFYGIISWAISEWMGDLRMIYSHNHYFALLVLVNIWTPSPIIFQLMSRLLFGVRGGGSMNPHWIKYEK